ncbi:MAG: quinolinate synthase NadA [Clostridia bacterium]|nr:quinolinate synthase NadA [Clostridia bacterium]
MKIREIQDEILRLKKEKDFCILAHTYQTPDICEIADFVGDSYALSVKAQGVENKSILMCGVRFMAETAKILSPKKRVFLSHKDAGCPMAEQFTRDYILATKKRFPEHKVVAYINTTAELKMVCDVCVTSSSALKIVKNMDSDKILFIPDINLGSYIAQKCPEKDIQLLKGGCPVHSGVTEEDVLDAKKAHPDALLLVHPECTPDVVKYADVVGSTKDIIDFAVQSTANEFIIGTENSTAEHLALACPEKDFYVLSKNLICPDMKLTTLSGVLGCLNGSDGEEIIIDDDTISKARHCIDEMLRLGN